MGPDITEITYYGPRDASLDRGEFSLGPVLGLIELTEIFKRRTTIIFLA